MRVPPAESTFHTSSDYCDTRLHELDISFWTSVPISNEFAANVISLYLETDHPLLGIFDPALFISDLVTWKLQFCSRLLVNAILYWACVSYRDYTQWLRAVLIFTAANVQLHGCWCWPICAPLWRGS